MSGGVETSNARRAGNVTASIVTALAGLAVGAGVGWWHAGSGGVDPSALEEETAAAMQMADPVERRNVLLPLFARMRPETIAGIQAGFEREFRFADKCVVPPFASAWAAFDPISAFEAAEAWDHPSKRSQATSEVAYLLARTGRVDRARTMASELALGRVRFPTFAGLAEGIIRSGDLDGATRYLVEHPDSADRNRIIERFLQYFTLTADLDGLIAWAESIPEDAPHQLRRSAFPLAARWLGSTDPERAAAWIDAQPEDEEFTDRARVAIASEWIERDPDAALAWLLSHTTPGKRSFELRTVIRRLVDRNPVEAAEWMERQEPLGDLVVTLPLVVRGLREEHPAEALAWAARIEDAKRRNELIAYVAGTWLAEEPEAATAWLGTSALSDELRMQIEAESLNSTEDESTWQ